jgi:glyoxylase-like metal-dependent hydrolase (beta-lactamase superfamily II)
MFMKNYSYMIVDERTREAAIIDPAWDINKILMHLKDLQLDLTTVLLTHHHFDHVNLAKRLVNELNVRVYIHYKEIDYHKFYVKNMIPISDAGTISLGDAYINCIHTPGHTYGGMCYHTPGFLFTGDTVFIEGCGICSKNSVYDMYLSIQKIKNKIAPDTIVCPGHSYGKEPGVTLSYLLENNIYFQLNEKYFKEFRMRKNQKNLYNFK